MDLFRGKFSPCFSDFIGCPSTTYRRCRCSAQLSVPSSASISLTLIRLSHLHYCLQGASIPCDCINMLCTCAVYDTLFFVFVGHVHTVVAWLVEAIVAGSHHQELCEFLKAVLNADAGSLRSRVCLVATALVCLLALILPLKSVRPRLFSKATFVRSSPPGLYDDGGSAKGILLHKGSHAIVPRSILRLRLWRHLGSPLLVA